MQKGVDMRNLNAICVCVCLFTYAMEYLWILWVGMGGEWYRRIKGRHSCVWAYVSTINILRRDGPMKALFLSATYRYGLNI